MCWIVANCKFYYRFAFFDVLKLNSECIHRFVKLMDTIELKWKRDTRRTKVERIYFITFWFSIEFEYKKKKQENERRSQMNELLNTIQYNKIREKITFQWINNWTRDLRICSIWRWKKVGFFFFLKLFFCDANNYAFCGILTKCYWTKVAFKFWPVFFFFFGFLLRVFTLALNSKTNNFFLFRFEFIVSFFTAPIIVHSIQLAAFLWSEDRLFCRTIYIYHSPPHHFRSIRIYFE